MSEEILDYQKLAISTAKCYQENTGMIAELVCGELLKAAEALNYILEAQVIIDEASEPVTRTLSILSENMCILSKHIADLALEGEAAQSYITSLDEVKH